MGLSYSFFSGFAAKAAVTCREVKKQTTTTAKKQIFLNLPTIKTLLNFACKLGSGNLASRASSNYAREDCLGT